ncbi:MAG: hypothetical protein Q9220_000556 [cf. Caloplaca sp. 1 TL-2023]
MSQQAAAKSFRSTFNTVLRPGVSNASNNPSTLKPGWRPQAQSNGETNAPQIPEILEEGEIAEDPLDRKSRGKPSSDLHPASQAIRRSNSRVSQHSVNPPSFASIARAASYTPYQRPAGYTRPPNPESTTERDYLRQRREANRGVRLRKGEYALGMIIRAPLHEQDSKGGAPRSTTGGSNVSVASSAPSEATLAEKYTTESRFGPIFTKYRKMIVVALHEVFISPLIPLIPLPFFWRLSEVKIVANLYAMEKDNYVAVPLYTHNGNGLTYKTQPDEFVSVKDHRYRDDPSWKKLSKWDPLVTESIKDGIDLFDPKSTAHLAYPVSRRYALPVVYEGNLRPSSFRLLAGLYRSYAAIDG